jgi:hypothetical protein
MTCLKGFGGIGSDEGAAICHSGVDKLFSKLSQARGVAGQALQGGVRRG